MDKFQNRRLCLVISVILCSLFWISWSLEMGLIGCLETTVRNYHSMLYNISEERRSHMTVWWCRPRFVSTFWFRCHSEVNWMLSTCVNISGTKSFIISADILWTNFNVFNNPSLFLFMHYWCSATPSRWSR